MNEGDIVSWTKDKEQLKLILGMPTDQTNNKRWVRITESKHPKYRRGMIFIINMSEVTPE